MNFSTKCYWRANEAATSQNLAPCAISALKLQQGCNISSITIQDESLFQQDFSKITILNDARPSWCQLLIILAVSHHHYLKKLRQNRRTAQSVVTVFQKWVWHLRMKWLLLLHKSRQDRNIPADFLPEQALPPLYMLIKPWRPVWWSHRNIVVILQQ